MLKICAGIACLTVRIFSLAVIFVCIDSASAQSPGRFGDPFAERGLEFGTKNFLAIGPTTAIARRVAEEAEKHRKRLARLWLGKEIPDWPQRCPICIRLDAMCGGYTNFNFANGQETGPQVRINVQGDLDTILSNVLPHEMTHVVLATYFRKPVPRWADEAAAMLSESKPRCDCYRNAFCTQPAPRRMYGVQNLFQMREYPGEPKLFYDQSYSIANYLVCRKDRATFVTFVRSGVEHGWSKAAKDCYGFNSITGLESAWLATVDNPPTPEQRAKGIAKSDGAIPSTIMSP